MRKVVTIGETVWDIIFRQGIPVTAKPGGSMLNASVSLGRTGTQVVFISETGKDKPGEIISDFLVQNGVTVDYIQQYVNRNTSIALAFLDGNSDAKYSFYRDLPEDRLTIDLPEISENDILLFGSYYSISAEIRPKLARLIRSAKEKNALIIYDPNFRRSHMSELEKVRLMIMENISFSDIVRCSDEDCRLIFGTSDPDKAFHIIRNAGCHNLVFTRNKESVEAIYPGGRLTVPVQSIEPVSTIGAGDSFNAGIAWFLMKKGIKKQDIANLADDDRMEMIHAGISFSGDVCMSYENYISLNFSENLQS